MSLAGQCPARETIRSKHEGRGQGSGVPTVEALLRETHALVANLSVRMSPSNITRLVRDYTNLVAGKGVPFGTYLANAVALHADQRHAFDALYYRLSHADPTGEAAARNVDRERGGRVA